MLGLVDPIDDTESHLTSTPIISLGSGDLIFCGGPLKSDVYYQLWRLNRSGQRALRSLEVLQRQPAFRRRQLDRCRALWREALAVTNSYLTECLEIAETEEAGRRFRQRRARDHRGIIAVALALPSHS